MKSQLRINAFLATALRISRRKADQVVAENRVMVNGSAATVGQVIDLGHDRVTVDGYVVENQTLNKTRIVLYKPREYITSRTDQWGRKTVIDLLPEHLKHLNTAGRLDYLSEGVILMSDDGAFNHEYTHPRFEKEKEYILTLTEPVAKDLIEGFRTGVPLQEGLAKADTVDQISETALRVTIHQGWKRQLRRMAAHHGFTVHSLVRTRIGQFEIEGLQPGEWMVISD
ncbi:MAG TPA: pseudouridine synthase [Dehalococcoidia bacterium]|nr:rRNA pseudouridine synthase [SAR202 cluster bacterium]HAA94591.1 pseudouridine synthase [Dehalococcoidia bacterium]|tara:strand:+ start:6068 stop:6748 length:681 start_codon:yes stop_codon:yes gene_type:complete